MNHKLAAKQYASSSVEELLHNSPNNDGQNNWLLSYLDVFVLMVMLVITLLAISDINAPAKKNNKQHSITRLKPSNELNKEPISESRQTITPQPAKKQIIHTETETTIASTHTKPSSSTMDTTEKIKYIPQEEIANKPEILQTATLPFSSLFPQTSSPSYNHPSATARDPIATALETVNVLEIFADDSISALDENDISMLSTDPDQLINSQQDYWQQQLDENLNGLEINDFVSIKVKEGFAQIEIQDNILFASGVASLTVSGKDLLHRLSPILKQSSGLIFIEGHTDNRPINNENYLSNWELASARSTGVLHVLASLEIGQSRLRAVSYAHTLPIADNSTLAGRAKNRRVNILIKIPETLKDKKVH